MLNRTTLIDQLMAGFKGTPNEIQNERARLYAKKLDLLGKEFEQRTGKNPHELKAA